MTIMHRYLTALAATLWALNSLADAQVTRCQYPDGRVLFSQNPCPANTESHTQPIQLNSPLKLNTPSAQPRPPGNPSVVRGIEQALACQTRLSPQQMRQALIRQQPQTGMSRAQVLSAFGKPLRSSYNRQGEQFVYSLKNGRMRTLQFDDKGCLRR